MIRLVVWMVLLFSIFAGLLIALDPSQIGVPVVGVVAFSLTELSVSLLVRLGIIH